MFSLYGHSGQYFRGTLEQLAELPGITRARGARALAREGEVPLPGDAARAASRPHAGHPGGFEAAARSYRDMLNLELERGPLYHAYQIMTREVFTLSAGEAVTAAWRDLLGRGLRQAPVLDEGGELVGLVTERDLLTTFNLERRQARPPVARHVGDVMTSPIVSADPVTDIRRIARVLLRYDLPGVPVVNEARALLGFVSRGDILGAVVADPPLSLWG